MEAVAGVEVAPKYRFKIIRGGHAYNAGTDLKPELVVFNQGDIVETHLELDKMHNSPGSIKFERLDTVVEDTPEILAELEAELKARRDALAKKAAGIVAKKEAGGEDKFGDLNKMTYAQLTELAELNEIDLSGAKNKEEALRILKGNKSLQMV